MNVNWKSGLLRLWLVLSVPTALWCSWQSWEYSQSALSWQKEVEQWYPLLSTPEKTIFDAKEQFDHAVAGRDYAKGAAEFHGRIAWAVPLGLGSLMLAGLWVTAGFRSKG